MKYMPFFRCMILLCFLLIFQSILIAQNNNGSLDLIEELGTKFKVPIQMPGGVELMTDIYLPITSDSFVFSTTILGQTISVELIPKGTQLAIYPEIKDSNGVWIPNPNPYQLPLLLSRTPYGKNALGTLGNVIPILGYAFANQDVRGRYESEGVFIPMYNDGWKKSPYHLNNHVLDITSPSDSNNARDNQDGWYTYQYLLNDYKRAFDVDNDQSIDTIAPVCNGTIGLVGASAFALPQLQIAASQFIDPSTDRRGAKGQLTIIASAENYNTTLYHNGVFRQNLVAEWLGGSLNDMQNSPAGDSSLQNAIHSPFDYGLTSELDVIERSIDQYTTHRFPGQTLSNAYPNSLARYETDISKAPIDLNGQSNINGSRSRYENMQVPTYHLSGWYDIFADGQLKTWQYLKEHTNTKQKLIIGPWAHFTISMQNTGDVRYPSTANDVLGFSGDGLDFTSLDGEQLSKILGSEPIEFLRYTLNRNGYQHLGDPVIRIPESTNWQGNTLQVRVPSENYDLTLVQLLNFIGGQGSLPSIPVEAKLGILPTVSLNIPFPNIAGTIPLPFTLNSPIEEPTPIDFDTLPDIRYYVIGPTDSTYGNELIGNYWIEDDRFPPDQGVQYVSYFMHSDSSLSLAAPSSDEGTLSYIHDPENPVQTVGGNNLFIQTPDGRDSWGQMNYADSSLQPLTMPSDAILSFTTEAFEDSLSMIGFPRANIFASSRPDQVNQGPTDTDFFIRILDIYPDGRELFVCEGAVNARARNYAKSIYDQMENDQAVFDNINIDQVYQYQFNLLPIAYTFGRQHKMKVVISSSNYPRYQCNPNLPIEDGDFFRRKPGDGQTYLFQGINYAPRVATNSIYISDSLPSSIEIPVLNANQNTVINNVKTENSLSLQPNPADDILTIQIPELSEIIEVFDVNGIRVIQEPLHLQKQVQFSVKQLPAGQYFVRCRGKSQIYSARFIKL